MTESNGLMKGKRGLIMGVANNRSIAYGIAKALCDAGAEVALTYQGEALKKRVEPIAAELGATIAGHCDVADATGEATAGASSWCCVCCSKCVCVFVFVLSCARSASPLTCFV